MLAADCWLGDLRLPWTADVAGRVLLHAVAHRPAFGLLALDLLLLAHRQDLLGLTLGVGVGDRAERLRARLQVGARDQAGARPIELGQQRAARVGGDRHDRARARPETEPVERQNCFVLVR